MSCKKEERKKKTEISERRLSPSLSKRGCATQRDIEKRHNQPCTGRISATGNQILQPASVPVLRILTSGGSFEMGARCSTGKQKRYFLFGASFLQPPKLSPPTSLWHLANSSYVHSLCYIYNIFIYLYIYIYRRVYISQPRLSLQLHAARATEKEVSHRNSKREYACNNGSKEKIRELKRTTGGLFFFFPYRQHAFFSAIERFHPSSKPQDLATILITNEKPNGGGTSKDEVPRSRAPFLREQTGFKIEGREVSAKTL